MSAMLFSSQADRRCECRSESRIGREDEVLVMLLLPHSDWPDQAPLVSSRARATAS